MPRSSSKYSSLPDTKKNLNDDNFIQGIRFIVKLIGSLPIKKPSTRVEIVSAMRRTRFEFKERNVKKKTIQFEISYDGVKCFVLNKKAVYNAPLLSHPIYRIFYISHDSQDTKIFSYITRETATNLFYCVVFKAKNKSQAMKIVKTVGEAFEFCHDKLAGSGGEPAIIHDDSPSISGQKAICNSEKAETPTLTKEAEEDEDEVIQLKSKSTAKENTQLNLNLKKDLIMREFDKSSLSMTKERKSEGILQLQDSAASSSDALSPIDLQVQLLREQLKQQKSQTAHALSQVALLRDQLNAEQSARVEAQTRTQQLLNHNKELIDHLQILIRHIQNLENNGTNFDQNFDQNSRSSLTSLNSEQTKQLIEMDHLRRQNAALTILLENRLNPMNSIGQDRDRVERLSANTMDKIMDKIAENENIIRPLDLKLINRSVSEKITRNKLEFLTEKKSSWQRHTTK